MGVGALNLGHVASDQMDNGNALALVGSYEGTDGQTHDMADVWFAKARSEAPPPQISDLLADAPTDLAPAVAAAPATEPAMPSVDMHAALAAVKLNPFEEELLRNQPLI
jgi:trimeric autotransporter adhesin